MGIRAVVFDIGGVLLRLGEWEYRSMVARHCGRDPLPPDYEAAVPFLQRGEASEEELWARLAGRRVSGDAFDGAFRAFFPPFPEMLAVAAELRALGLHTAILSNTQASHVRVIRTMGFLDAFDPVVLSCEAGCRKPEAASFETVLGRLRMPPTDVAFVDDMDENVAAAVALGLKGILHTGDAATTSKAIWQML